MVLKKFPLYSQFYQMNCRCTCALFCVILSVYLASGVIDVKAQTEELVISGRVVDAADGSVIADANVFIEHHSHIGEPTDRQGQFTLRIPGFIVNDNLVISALGFNTKKP